MPALKPLYYSETPRGTIFASELKSLLQESSVDRTLDGRSVRDHLLYLWCPSPRTMLRNVQKLEPGHALLVRDGEIEKHWQFYDLPFDRDFVDWPKGDAVVQVRKYLTRAVERQLVSDVPVGAFLSGGLDSSGLVAIAQRRLHGERLQCFTIGFESQEAVLEGMAADLPYARRVAEHVGVDLHTIWVGPEMVDDLPKMIFHLDEPQADPAPINALYITRLAGSTASRCCSPARAATTSSPATGGTTPSSSSASGAGCPKGRAARCRGWPTASPRAPSCDAAPPRRSATPTSRATHASRATSTGPRPA